MPAIASITLNDGTNNIVLTPVQAAPTAKYVGNNGATGAGADTLELSFSLSNKSKPVDTTKVTYSDPVERGDAVSGYKVTDTARFVGYFYIPETMTSAERIAFKTKCDALVVHAILDAIVQSRESIY